MGVESETEPKGERRMPHCHIPSARVGFLMVKCRGQRALKKGVSLEEWLADEEQYFANASPGREGGRAPHAPGGASLARKVGGNPSQYD